MTRIERVKELVAESANEMRLAYQCRVRRDFKAAIEHEGRAQELACQARAINEAAPTERQREKAEQEMLSRADDLHEYLTLKGETQ